jgi:hypothetical protein
MMSMTLQPNPELEREVTELALEHGIVTPWTAFVAVMEQEASARAEQQGAGTPPQTIATGESASEGTFYGDEREMRELSAAAPGAADVAAVESLGGGCAHCNSGGAGGGPRAIALSLVCIALTISRRRRR